MRRKERTLKSPKPPESNPGKLEREVSRVEKESGWG